MKRRQAIGFTIVELAVVIVVIGILASIVLLSYNRVQAEARDTKRKTDIELLANELEKYYLTNGEYPTGCSFYSSSAATSCPLTGPNGSALSHSGLAFYSDTVNTTLLSNLPGLSAKFGDPSYADNTPFNAALNTGATKHYLYYGQYEANATKVGVAMVISGPGAIANGLNCDDTTPLWIGWRYRPGGTTGVATGFIVGYFSEAEQKWYIYRSTRGYSIYRGTWDPYSDNPSEVLTTSDMTIGRCVFVN